MSSAHDDIEAMGDGLHPPSEKLLDNSRKLEAGRAQTTDLVLPRLLSTQELCAVFRRSSRTIRQWCRGGKLTPVRVGRAVFFRADAVLRMISGTRTPEKE